MAKAHIVVLGTGGTIAGKAGDVLKGSEYVPGVEGVDGLLDGLGVEDAIDVRAEQVASVGSEDMTEEIWFRLTRAITEAVMRPEVDGVVVVHGTDTMEETACFLDVMLSTHKPVILTGSMRPSNVVGADGPANLSAAIRLAASPRARERGVLVVFSDQIYAARDVVKVEAMGVDAFDSPGFGSLGRVVDGEPLWFRSRRRNAGWALFSLPEAGVLPRVEIIYGHAGQRPEMVQAALDMGVKGIVHAGVGAGNIHVSVKPLLLEAAKNGVAVVAASRCGAGFVTVREEKEFIYPCGLNPQKARVLLQCALGRTREVAEIQKIFTLYMFEDFF